MDRASGRDRSEIADLNRRLKALDEDLERFSAEVEFRLKDADSSPESSVRLGSLDRAFLFTLEAYAWTVLQRLRAELFEKRFEMPKNDAEVFSILQKHEVLDLVEARKLRQFCESRHLASRDFEKIDLAGVLGQVQESLPETRETLGRVFAS
jgi:uncharacterized protein YutE (UPF0331/DUF86 family)